MATFGDVITGVLVSELAVDDDFVMSDALNKQQVLLQNLLFKKQQNRKKLMYHLALTTGRKKRQGPINRRRFVQGTDGDGTFLDHDYVNGSVPRFCSNEFEEFQSHFTIRRSTFDKIVSLVGPKFGSQEKASLPIERKVLVSLWMLSSQDSFKTIGDKFGLQKSTTYYAFMQFINILSSMSKTIIVWPDNERLNSIAGEFQRSYRLPNVAGAVGKCQIPVKISGAEERSGDGRSEPHSAVILQAVCDHATKFLDVYVRSSLPNLPLPSVGGEIFESSPLRRRLSAEGGVMPPGYYLAGGASYRLRKNLLTPYEVGCAGSAPLSDECRKFNEALLSANAVVRRAFGVVRTRFARLKYVDASRYDLVPQMVVAACALHNVIVEEEGEAEMVAEDWENDEDDERRMDGCPVDLFCADEEAVAMRDAVARSYHRERR